MNETLDEANKPESAAVEPVAWMYVSGEIYRRLRETTKPLPPVQTISFTRWPSGQNWGWTETPLIPATALTALTERVERLEEENARLRRALLPFAQLNKRIANYVIQPDEQIVREAVRALEK